MRFESFPKSYYEHFITEYDPPIRLQLKIQLPNLFINRNNYILNRIGQNSYSEHSQTH